MTTLILPAFAEHKTGQPTNQEAGEQSKETIEGGCHVREPVKEQEDNHTADETGDRAPRPDALCEYSHKEKATETAGQKSKKEIELVPQGRDVKGRQGYGHQDSQRTDDDSGHPCEPHFLSVRAILPDLCVEILTHDRS